MLQKRSPACIWQAVTVAVLFGSVVSGCGDSDPVKSEPPTLADLFGNQLYRADGTTLGLEALNDVPVIGIYFASPTCPACGNFTPLLVSAYEQIQAQDQSFEIVLASSGADVSSVLDYMTDSNMGWLSVPPNQANLLVQYYSVRFIPTLVVIDDQARLISLSGREEVAQHGSGAYDDWLSAATGG